MPESESVEAAHCHGGYATAQNVGDPSSREITGSGIRPVSEAQDKRPVDVHSGLLPDYT